MARTRKTKTSAEIEQEIKALQEKLAKAKQREAKNRFSVETRKRLNAIMENHNVKLSDAESVCESSSSEGGKNSRLNPLFVEEMMGFPLMWTACPFLSESGEPKP